jgi:ketosteroid isomerase-like protein
MNYRLKTLAREIYGAYVSGDRSVLDRLVSEDFRFYSPADVGIHRAQYFERCWPNSKMLADFQFVRLIEAGEEVLVTYEATRTDGTRFRNSEVLRFDDGRLTQAEVYFGWDLPS